MENQDPQAAGEQMTVSPEMFKRFARYSFEEVLRRMLKNAEAFSKTKILQLLVPKYAEVVNEYKAQVQTKIENSMAAGDGKGQDEYAQFYAQADVLRAQAAAAEDKNGAAASDKPAAEE